MDQVDLDPEELARNVALSVSSKSSEVGDFISATMLEAGVVDYRFDSHIMGYEGWQWSITLYHDEEANVWTVDESSLVPSEQALLPPKWIPWKDRLLPTDLAVTDVMGTDPDDPRLLKGYVQPEADVQEVWPEDGSRDEDELGRDSLTDARKHQDETPQEDEGESGLIFKVPNRSDSHQAADPGDAAANLSSGNGEEGSAGTSAEDLEEVVDELALSRRHLMTSQARAETAKRWYEGQHGPKSLSTKVAKGNLCQTCGFMIPLKGELGTMFAVCANRWSPDDGRVVSLDHGCGEHSEIEPQEETHLWVQSQPAFDDLHIDVVRQKTRDESPEVELMEEFAAENEEDGEGD